MTTLRTISFLLLICLVLSLVAHGTQTSRRAKIEDTSGVKSDVTDLDFYSRDWSDLDSGRTYNRDEWVHLKDIIFSTEGLNLSILLNSIKSITFKGGKSQKDVEVTYVWLGEEKKITGQLVDGELRCSSDFGPSKIHSSKLKEVLFVDPPIAISESDKKSLNEALNRNKAVLVLTNDREVPE